MTTIETSTDSSVVVYADTGSSDDLPVPTISLEEAWPGDIVERIDGAAELVILDALSFPYEFLTERSWEVPIVVAVPTHVDVDTIEALLGEPLLERLTPFDRLLIDDDSTWNELSRRFGFLSQQRTRHLGRTTGEIVARLSATRKVVDPAARVFERPLNQIDRWALRTRRNKRQHMTQTKWLRRVVAEAAAGLPQGVRLQAAHFGMGIGRFTGAYRGCEVIGLDPNAWSVAQARFNLPQIDFRILGPGRQSGISRTSMDLTVSTHMVSQVEPDQRLSLLGEMWAITRVGGQLVVLDDFFSPDALDADGLVQMLVGITGNAAVLSEVASLRYDDSGRIGDGLVVLTKIGVPNRW